MSQSVHNSEIQDLTGKLFGAIFSEQKKINSLCPPSEEFAQLTKRTLEDFSKLSGQEFFYDYLSQGVGHGPFTQLIDGSVKYDLFGPAGLNLLGRSHPLHIKAHLEAAASDQLICHGLLARKEVYDLTKVLLDTVKKSSLKYFYVCHSPETLLSTHFSTMDSTPNRFISLQKSDTFNFDSWGITKEAVVDIVRPGEEKIEQQLKEITRIHKNKHSTLLIDLFCPENRLDPVDTSTIARAVEWASENNIKIWVNETVSFGRTREIFAFQCFDFAHLINFVSVGGALGITGLLSSEKLNLQGPSNYCFANVAFRIAEKMVRYLIEGNFLGNSGRVAYLEHAFLSRINHLTTTTCRKKISRVSGNGTHIAFQLNCNEKTTNLFIKNLFKNGVIAGLEGGNISFFLPLSLRDEHIDELIRIIEKTTHETIED